MLYPFPPLVLLIDVDNINTPICEKVILHLGFSVTHIPSCVGFGYLGGAKPAAVVLDAQCCPNVFETLALIEQQFPEAALIVIVGRDEHVQARFAIRLGANYVMQKPCAVAEIEEIFRFVAEHGAVSRNVATTARNEPASSGSMAQIERRAILSAVRAAQGDKISAAKMLGISKATMYRKLQRYRREKNGQKVVSV